jgi:catechol 2,3-dioxygenase-like lactoylglutathione lyase family enzyme
MGKFTGLEGTLLVKDQKEAFAFYKKVFGMKEVFHHGYYSKRKPNRYIIKQNNP